MECRTMGQRFRRGFTAAEKTELWDRWQRGDSLKAIGRAFGKPSSLFIANKPPVLHRPVELAALSGQSSSSRVCPL